VWRQVEVLYTSYATHLPDPERVPRLRWIQLYSAGVDALLAHPLLRTSVRITTASGIHAVTMAEYTFAAVLACYHQLPRVLEWQSEARWPTAEERLSLFAQAELWGKTLGVVGYGSVGRHVARLAVAFGMRVLAMQRGADPNDRGFTLPGTGDPEGRLPAHYYAPAELHAMLAESDVVVIAAPLTAATRGLFDETAFAAMKPTAYLVNCARGEICDETALVCALQARRIAGAALDVFPEEPLPRDHPLWRLPNVLLSPHISALSPHYGERAAALFAENLRRFLADEPLYNLVDREREY
jgi:phosphoglycerate dehydrogenase-like enzyme